MHSTSIYARLGRDSRMQPDEGKKVPTPTAAKKGDRHKMSLVVSCSASRIPYGHHGLRSSSISSDASSNDDDLASVLSGNQGFQRSSVSSDTSSNNDDLVSLLGDLTINPNSAIANEYYGRDIPRRTSMSAEPIDSHTNKLLLQRFMLQFTRPGRFQPDLEIPIWSTIRKTAAVLRRGKNDPLIVAVSGWSNMFPSEYEYVLDQELMIDQVFEMCKRIGHKLKKNSSMDGGRAGAYHACHAEMQLLASIFSSKRNAKELDIFVSRKPCQECKSCVGKFEEEMNVEVRLHFTR